jgi:hypothetical protein
VRQGGWKRELVKGKRWLLLARWITLETENQRLLNQLFQGQPPDVESLPAQGSLGQLWNHVYEGAMLNYL